MNICKIHEKSYFSTCDECGKKLQKGDKYKHFRTGEILEVEE